MNSDSPERDGLVACCAFCTRIRSPDGRWITLPVPSASSCISPSSLPSTRPESDLPLPDIITPYGSGHPVISDQTRCEHSGSSYAPRAASILGQRTTVTLTLPGATVLSSV
jgi:hypothetical protein